MISPIVQLKPAYRALKIPKDVPPAWKIPLIDRKKKKDERGQPRIEPPDERAPEKEPEKKKDDPERGVYKIEL